MNDIYMKSKTYFRTTIDRVHSAIEVLEDLKRISAERGYDWTNKFGNTYINVAINYLRTKHDKDEQPKSVKT